MRRALSLIAACLLLAGCTDSTGSPTSPVTNAPTAQTSSPATSPSPTTSPTSPTTPEPSVDYQGRPLEGIPDCNWQELNLKIDGQEPSHSGDGNESDIVRTHFSAENSTGADCVVRHAPKSALLDNSGQLMSPIFAETQSEGELPWVLPDGFSIHLYFESPSVSSASMCPQTAEYAKHLNLTFDNGEVIDYGLRDVIYACPNATPRAETVMKMHLVQ